VSRRKCRVEYSQRGQLGVLKMNLLELAIFYTATSMEGPGFRLGLGLGQSGVAAVFVVLEV
jgi:hypothetical protein